jgi:hypothetical protein
VRSLAALPLSLSCGQVLADSPTRHTVALTILVADEQGTPVQGARVSIRVAAGKQVSQFTLVNGTTQFQVPAGLYAITAYSPPESSQPNGRNNRAVYWSAQLRELRVEGDSMQQTIMLRRDSPALGMFNR